MNTEGEGSLVYVIIRQQSNRALALSLLGLSYDKWRC